MKTICLLFATFGIASLLSSSIHAQTEESIYTNGNEVFLHKNNSASLKSFLARNVDGKTYLAWVTENMNADGSFIIYRSADGENYEIIGVKQTEKGTTADNKGYYFVDNKPNQSGPSCYKIMHIGTDNAFFISGKITVKLPVINFADTSE